MGTCQTATWLALFALIANAGSGLGLEYAQPCAVSQASTVCEAQSVIAALIEPASGPSDAGDVCQFQWALGRAASDGESLADPFFTPLFGVPPCAPEVRSESALSPPPIATFTLLKKHEPAAQLRQALDFVPPPGTATPDRFRHALHGPNSPPHLA